MVFPSWNDTGEDILYFDLLLEIVQVLLYMLACEDKILGIVWYNFSVSSIFLSTHSSSHSIIFFFSERERES